VSQCVIIMENYTNSEMTDMVFCYGCADGVGISFVWRKVSDASCSAFPNISGCCHQRKFRTMQKVLQGFGTIYIEGHRRVLETRTDVLNIVSNNTSLQILTLKKYSLRKVLFFY
jgi:hypothetical protein